MLGKLPFIIVIREHPVLAPPLVKKGAIDGVAAAQREGILPSPGTALALSLARPAPWLAHLQAWSTAERSLSQEEPACRRSAPLGGGGELAPP